jgi:MFS family permease
VNNATKKTALLVSTLGAFLAPFSSHSINIALPSIGKEFIMNAISLSWLVTAYLLASAIFLVPLGRIADIYGRKRIFTYGILTFTVTSFFYLFRTLSKCLFGSEYCKELEAQCCLVPEWQF